MCTFISVPPQLSGRDFRKYWFCGFIEESRTERRTTPPPQPTPQTDTTTPPHPCSSHFDAFASRQWRFTTCALLTFAGWLSSSLSRASAHPPALSPVNPPLNHPEPLMKQLSVTNTGPSPGGYEPTTFRPRTSWSPLAGSKSRLSTVITPVGQNLPVMHWSIVASGLEEMAGRRCVALYRTASHRDGRSLRRCRVPHRWRREANGPVGSLFIFNFPLAERRMMKIFCSQMEKVRVSI